MKYKKKVDWSRLCFFVVFCTEIKNKLDENVIGVLKNMMSINNGIFYIFSYLIGVFTSFLWKTHIHVVQ